MNPDYSELTDEQILAKLDDAQLMHRFEQSDDWRLFREACERLSKQADFHLDKLDPIRQPSDIIYAQTIKKFYRNVLSGVATAFKNEGKLAFDEAKDRGIIKPPVLRKAKQRKV